MKNLLTICFAVFAAISISSCSINDLQDFLKDPKGSMDDREMFHSPLRGSEEVPPVMTNATGQNMLQLSKDGMSLSYKLSVDNIENIGGAHLHLGARGENGPVVASLLPMGTKLSGPQKGMIAEGTITKANLVGPLAGMNLSDLVKEMRAGMIYTNVHTTQHPAGEIRGQVMKSSK
jgi:hypothetical protein